MIKEGEFVSLGIGMAHSDIFQNWIKRDKEGRCLI
jgi:hypothetical protein